MSTYASDPELRGVTDDDGHELDVASSPADGLVRVIAFAADRGGGDVALYLTPAATLQLVAALLRQVERLDAWRARASPGTLAVADEREGTDP